MAIIQTINKTNIMRTYEIRVLYSGAYLDGTIRADGFYMRDGAYHFYDKNKDNPNEPIVKCLYPINLTIIESIEITKS